VNNNDVLSLDWIGPISPPAYITDNQYIMTFTIKKTRFRGAGFAQLRSEAPELLKAFIREHGAFKIIRMDNAKEFKSSQIQDICDNIEEFCVDNKVTFSLEEGQGTKVQLNRFYTCRSTNNETTKYWRDSSFTSLSSTGQYYIQTV
jgi:hypothetical protein